MFAGLWQCSSKINSLKSNLHTCKWSASKWFPSSTVCTCIVERGCEMKAEGIRGRWSCVFIIIVKCVHIHIMGLKTCICYVFKHVLVILKWNFMRFDTTQFFLLRHTHTPQLPISLSTFWRRRYEFIHEKLWTKQFWHVPIESSTYHTLSLFLSHRQNKPYPYNMILNTSFSNILDWCTFARRYYFRYADINFSFT